MPLTLDHLDHYGGILSQNVVDDKLAKMEAAAEADMEDHEKKRPAIQKLKILAEIQGFLAQVSLPQEERFTYLFYLY